MSNYKLVNGFEEIVMESVRKVMATKDMCQCEKCYLDACAYVFNHGYSHFVTTRQGEMYVSIADMNQANQVKMLVQVEEGLEAVRRSPKHDGTAGGNEPK